MSELRLAGWKSEEGREAYLATYDAALELWPVPYESKLIYTGFGCTHVVISGPPEGTPVFLLPAALGVGALQWYPNVAALAGSHRVFAVDFVGGPGKGWQTEALMTRTDYANWLCDLLQAIDADRAHMIGSSQGGWFALNLAIAEPDRVGDLMLLAPAASLRPFSAGTNLMLHLGTLMPGWTAGPSMKAAFGDRYRLDDRLIRLLALSLQHFRFQRKAVYPSEFPDDDLRRVRSRTLVVVGNKEIIYDPKAALDRADRLILDCATELVSGAGHLLNMERSDLIDELLMSFLPQPA